MSHAQSCKLVHVSGIHCVCRRPLHTVVLLCSLLCRTMLNIVVQCPSLKPGISGSKWKSSIDVQYCAFQGNERFKMFSVFLCLFFMYGLCEK